MAQLMRVPEVAAGATHVVLAEWLVKEGGTFASGDPVAVIETDKAQVEVEADEPAVLLRALAPEGVEIEVGAPMALVGAQNEVDSDLDARLAELGVRRGAEPTPAVRREVPEPAEQAVPPAQPAQAAQPAAASASGRRFASPLARKMLRDAGVDLAGVTGTGPGGRIVRRDAEDAIGRAAGVSADVLAPTADEPVTAGSADVGAATPHTRLRSAIAARLSTSKRDIPHFYLRRSIEVDELLGLRAQLNASAPVKVSVNDLLVKAVSVAHRAVPEANVIWTDEAMLSFDTVDVAVAVASERGLVTPVIRDIDTRSLGSVSSEVRRLVAAANDGTLKQRELEGGTITVTNLGMYGVDEFAAIINPPQSMILAIGAVREVPVARHGEIAVAKLVNVVLSVDHRAVDGALAARWLDAYASAVTAPMGLLL